jgi:superfamily II DNA/RNA helicase
MMAPKSLKQEIEEAQNAQIAVCTMGKFYDLMTKKTKSGDRVLDVRYLKSICIDEFDSIVASKTSNKTVMSTQDQLARIMEMIPPFSQRVFYSATVDEFSFKIANEYFREYNPSVGEKLIVLLNTEDYTLEGIRQYFVRCMTIEEKSQVLLDLITQCRITQCIVFANTIDRANKIIRFLDENGILMTSAVFHGELGEHERERIFRDVKENKIRLLISTDISARGIDIQGINLVINYDMPVNSATYIHRVGRSGRYGRKGVAISLLLVNDQMNEMLKVELINDFSQKSKMEELPDDLANLL